MFKSKNSINQLSGIKPTIKYLKYTRSENTPPKETFEKLFTHGPEYQALNKNYKVEAPGWLSRLGIQLLV